MNGMGVIIVLSAAFTKQVAGALRNKLSRLHYKQNNSLAIEGFECKYNFMFQISKHLQYIMQFRIPLTFVYGKQGFII
jgi:hypothetical protein